MYQAIVLYSKEIYMFTMLYTDVSLFTDICIKHSITCMYIPSTNEGLEIMTLLALQECLVV